MRKYNISMTTFFIYLLFIALCVGGYISNIVKIAGSSFDPLTALPILRVIGAFMPPLGAILGYV